MLCPMHYVYIYSIFTVIFNNACNINKNNYNYLHKYNYQLISFYFIFGKENDFIMFKHFCNLCKEVVSHQQRKAKQAKGRAADCICYLSSIQQLDFISQGEKTDTESISCLEWHFKISLVAGYKKD